GPLLGVPGVVHREETELTEPASVTLGGPSGRGATTRSAPGRVVNSTGVVPRSRESARAGSGRAPSIRTKRDRWTSTCGEYWYRPNAIDTRWRSSRVLEKCRKTLTSNLPSSSRAPGATVIPGPVYGPFETVTISARVRIVSASRAIH